MGARGNKPAGLSVFCEYAMFFVGRASLRASERLTYMSLNGKVATANTRDFIEQSTDVLVIGGGPAGLAAAIAARQTGLKVTLVDGARPPIDKACGEGLMPQTVLALRELGVSIHPSEGRKFQGIRFIDGTTSVEARFPETAGLGVRRTVLHQKMVERAQESGVSLLWNTLVTGLRPDGAVVGGRTMRARWIIGADGIRSRVRRWIGLASVSQKHVRFAHRRNYRVEPRTEFVEIFWRRKMQLYVTPLGNDEISVVLISREPGTRFEDALREYPEMAKRLNGAALSSAQRGAMTAMYSLDRVYRENVVLTGDASGGVDAITGEGLGLSFRQAMALAGALKTGGLEGYEVAHRRLARRPLLMSRVLLFLDRNPPFRKRIFGKFERDPALFARLLTLHARENSFSEIVAATARLGWQFLTV